MPSEKEADLGAVFGFFFLVFGTVQLKSAEITSVVCPGLAKSLSFCLPSSLSEGPGRKELLPRILH